jgi:hypothetical protein
MSLSRLLEGQWLEGRYGLERYIGHGSFGAVFEADHVVDGRSLRRVAVKVVECQDAVARDQMNELSAAASLDHPHVLRHFDFGRTRISMKRGEIEVLYLVMELASGTLEGQLRSGLMSTASAAKLTCHVAEALAYLHGQSKVHRDLKPDNILHVGGVWKLGDVGLTKDLGGEGAVRTRAQGARAYMAPEALLENEVAPAGDMWALGVTLLECLTGRQPYSADGLAEWLQVHTYQEPDIPAGLPEPFDAIIPGCLSKNRHQRLTSRQVLETFRSAPVKPPADPETLTVGASGAHFRSVIEAVDRAPSGARIVVHAGNYKGTVVLHRRVEIVAAGAVADVVLDGDGGPALRIAAPDAIVRGLSVRSSSVGARKGEAAIEIVSGRVLIDQCDVTSGLPACIRVESREANPVIRRCRIRQGRETGVWFTAGARGTLEECDLPDHATAGLWIADEANPVVRRCIIQRSKVRGVFVSEGGRGFLDGCVVTGSNGPGIEVARGGHVIVRDCRVVENRGAGLDADRDAKVTLIDTDLRRNAGGPTAGSAVLPKKRVKHA